MPGRPVYKLCLVLLLGFLLAACGSSGGGDDEDDVSSDASLSDLRPASGQLDQAFQPGQLDYSIAVDYLTSALSLVAVAADAGASIEIDGNAVASGAASNPILLPSGATLVAIVVTAEDGVTQRTYNLTLNRADASSFAQRAYVKASNPGSDDQFGWRVALSGDTLAVGAYAEASGADGINSGGQGDNSADFAGAVYIFTRSGGIWSQQAYIKASNSEADDRFGYSLALHDDRLAVGAYDEDSAGVGVNSGMQADNSAAGSGAVYIFTRSAGIWSQQAYVKASNAESNDQFGWRVALSGDRLAVSARGESSNATGVDVVASVDNSAAESGAVYLFGFDGGNWSQQAYIKASNTAAFDYFGASLGLSGNTLAVGAWGEDGSGSGVNSGLQVSNGAPGSGAVYVFGETGGAWSQQAYVKASNTGAGDLFGFNLALHGDRLAVGAPAEDSAGSGVNSATQGDNSNADAGAVYLYQRTGQDWSQQAYIKPRDGDASDGFGYALALAGNSLAIGAYREDSNGSGLASGAAADNSAADSGAAYLFTDSGIGWAQRFYIKATDSGAGDYFGASLALGAERLAVGAYLEDSNGSGVDSGVGADDSLGDSGAVYLLR